jgi:hypothetical protein
MIIESIKLLRSHYREIFKQSDSYKRQRSNEKWNTSFQK